MKTIGNIRKLFLLLALIVAGVQSVKAGYHRYTFYQTKTIDNLTYDIYLESYSDNGSFYFGTSFSYAVLKGISGTAEEVTIPFMLDDHTYVSYVDGTISNSSVKSLTFTGSISFTGSLSTGSSDVTIDGFLNCPNLQTIIIENGNITLKYFRENSPTFKCPNLTDIYFKNNTAPEFKGEWYCESDGIAWRNPSWSHICSAPGSNVTAHVEAWTQEVCDQMHQSANVYKDLKAVVPAGKAVVTVAVSGGARFLADGIGELSDEMTTTKYLERNSNLTFYAYPSNSNCYVAHVYVNDTDVKNQMTPTSDGRLQYTLENLQDDVVIRVVGEEKVKITVSVEEAGAGNGVLFRYNKDEYIYGRGTKTYTKIKHINYTFYVADGNKATIKNVFVNGEDVYQDLVEVTDSENPFYDASNVRKYTIENVNSDITIRITSVETVDHYTLCAGSGGKIEFDFDNTHHSYANNNYCQLAFNKSQTLTVTATPDEGYEFESFWFEGMKLDSDMGEWITMETQDDGKFVVNLALGTYEVPFTDNSYVVAFTFKNTSNPTWTVLQSGGMMGSQVAVTRNGENETMAVDGSVVTLPINDEGVEKVTLKVPIGNAVPVTKYQIRLESIASGTGTQIVSYLVVKCNMSRAKANALVESLPGLIPKQYDSEADAQTIVDDLTEIGAVAVIVPVTAGTQTIANNTPIRVVRNGEEVTFQMDFSDPLYATYEVPAASLTDETWEVSYDTSHRQIILRTGGSGAVEIGYKYIADEAITRSADKGLTTIDLPSFNSQYSNFVEFAIEAVENEEVKVYRNGSDVTDVFGEPQLLEGKNWYYFSSYTYNTQSELGFQLRESATWEIKIESSNKMLNAYANNDVIVSIAKLVDGEQPTFAGRENAIHRWINVGETCEVRFVPQHNENLTRFDIGWNSIDIENDSRLVKNDDGSYSFTITYDEISEKTFDILAVFSGGTNDENVVEYMFIGDFNKVYASADYNDDVTYEGYEFMQENVVGYYAGKVVENGQAANSEGAVEFWMPNANDTFRVYRNYQDMTNQFVPNGSGGWIWANNDGLIHAPAHWIIINENTTKLYDVNHDGKIDIADVTALVNKVLNE